MSRRQLPSIVVAGTHSGVGKTTVALGLMRALRKRGLIVAPFKVGPDYLDPAQHVAAAGRASHNLDGWMLDRAANGRVFAAGTEGADVAVIEGVMGLFDGLDGTSEAGSTAQMAKWVGAPVVLVLDCFAMARSAAATVLGFERFDPDLDFAGVILNRVAGRSHFEWMRQAIEPIGSLEILGGLVHDRELELPERHLGLVQPSESESDQRLDRLAEAVESAIDIEHLLRVATNRRGAAGLGSASATAATPGPEVGGGRPVRIGLPRDRAFAFYYEANLSALRAAGADIVEFSSLEGGLPAGLDGLYLGGGYPELFAEQLQANRQLRAELGAFADSGRPIHAECGGLMLLGESIEVRGTEYAMAGVLPIATAMSERLSLGYCEATFDGGSGPFAEGRTARGHRFHKSALVRGPEPNAWTTAEGERIGFLRAGVQASYLHLHFESEPALATDFVAACGRARGVG